MTWLRRAVLAAATVTLLVLLWRLDLARVWSHLILVGWGLGLILTQEIVAHILNAWGWRLAFSPGEARRHGVLRLLRLRIAGDGVNYLTPSATIAGEFMRAVMLPGDGPAEARYASVAVAKLTQALGQALFILAGLAAFAASGHPAFQAHPGLWSASMGLFTLALAALGAWGAVAWRRLKRAPASAAPALGPAPSWAAVAGAVPRQCLESFVHRPGRFGLSTLSFTVAYSWGAFEAYWICRFLDVPVGVATAFGIEILSLLVDSVFFMVPAKVGTQEAGKTAIFMALGLPPAAGFAFGVVRHVRELSWAALGLALCRRGSSPSPAPAATFSESAAV